MVSPQAQILLLCLAIIYSASSMPLSTVKKSYEVVKKNEIQTEPNDAVYFKKSSQRHIPQLFHAVELSKQNMKRQAKSLDKTKQRTPLEKGLWGKRVVIEASVSDKLPQDYTMTAERVSTDDDKEVDDTQRQNDVQNKIDTSLSTQQDKGIVLMPDDTKANDADKSAQYDELKKSKAEDAGSESEWYGPIEKGLWGKRSTKLPEDEIDEDLNSVIYLRRVNDVDRKEGMDQTRDRKNEKWTRYLILKRLDKSDKDVEGVMNDEAMLKFTNPVEKGLWGKRDVNEAYYNSLNEDYDMIKKDMDSEVRRRAEQSNLKPFKRIYLIS